jgi:hypothetical protein
LSEREESQATQVEPTEPQVASRRVWQVAPSQHPAAQELESQTHPPDWQRWPGPHASRGPQRQVPAAQPSALAGSQAVHAEPDAPHAAIEGALQAEAEQHPSGHEEASQVHPPAAQCCPAWQAGLPPQEQAPRSEHASASRGSHVAQEEPRLPQLSSDDARQAPWKQQPDGQLALSQTQAPWTHRCPSAHVGQGAPASGPAGSASATSTVTS